MGSWSEACGFSGEIASVQFAEQIIKIQADRKKRWDD